MVTISLLTDTFLPEGPGITIIPVLPGTLISIVVSGPML